MNQIENPVSYTCGICSEELVYEEIKSHQCFDDYPTVLITKEDGKIYPRKETGEIVVPVYPETINDSTNASEDNNELKLDYADNSNQYATNKENLSNNTRTNTSARYQQNLDEIIIAAIQERPQLWNYKDFPPSQRGVTVRNKLWEEVLDIVNSDPLNPMYSINTIKSKWKNLYDTCRGYLLKEKTKSGQAAKKNKPWKYAQQMSFLRDFLDLGIKKTVTNLKSPECAIAGTSSESTEFSDDSNLTLREDDEYDNQAKKKKKNDDAINKLVNFVAVPMPQVQFPAPPSIPLPPEKDEIDSFCTAIEKKLRKFPPNIASTAMFKIHELLYSYEKENLF